MDFNSALANLQRTANAVRNNTSSSHQGSNNRGGGGRGGGGGVVVVDGRGGPRGGDGGGRGRGGQSGGVDGPFDNNRRRSREEERGGRGFVSGGGAAAAARPPQRPRLDNQHQGPPRGMREGLLDPMRRFGYRVGPYRPFVPPSTSSASSGDVTQTPTKRGSYHICLLALTIDELPYEHIWKAWASESTDDSIYVSLVCHAKYPNKIRSEWLQSRLLTRKPVMGRGNSYADPEYFSFTPEWGSIQLTRAMISTLSQGMRIGQTFAPRGTITPGTIEPNDDPRFSSNRHVIRSPPPATSSNAPGSAQDKPTPPPPPPPVDAFVFISETCLPVRTLDECKQEIFNESNDNSKPLIHSWVAARNRQTPGTPRNKYEMDQFANIHRMIPGQYRWKADQWILLSRAHASSILNIDRHLRSSDQLWNSFAKISASDEMYFPTAMAVLGILRDNAQDDQQVVRRQVTYVDWSEGMRNPAAYCHGVRDFARVAKSARDNGSLFARKFLLVAPGSDQVTGTISVEEWSQEVTRLASISKNTTEATSTTSVTETKNDHVAVDASDDHVIETRATDEIEQSLKT